MKLKHLLFAVTLMFTTQIYAQTTRQVTGVVMDSIGSMLPRATVKLIAGKDSLVMATNINGRFTFTLVKAHQFSLEISSIGFQDIKRQYNLNPGNAITELDPIILKNDTTTLQDVMVININAIKIKEDTVEYNAAAYKVREGAVVEDAIKKMPGLDVNKDGNITAQGKQVSKVRLNGKDYMAGDVTSLTRTLPADLVHNIQVIDDYGEQASITGIKSGESQKVLNINIEKNKNHGYFGQGTVGGGHDAIPQAGDIKGGGRHVASTNIFLFQDKRQISLSGDLNNTNTSLFNFDGDRKSGGPPPLFDEDQNGITTARSLGFNYRDDWGKSLTVYGSYSFSNKSLYTVSRTIQDNISGQSPSIQQNNSMENERDVNHRFNLNVEYRPDTVNYFKFIPSFSFSGRRTNETSTSKLQAKNGDSTVITDYTGHLWSNSSVPNFGLNVLYNHRFHKRGRNFNTWITSGTATSNQYDNPVYNYLAGKVNAPVNQMINTESRIDSIGVLISYLEPIGKKSYLEFNYDYHNAHTTAHRMTDTVTLAGDIRLDADLSNDYRFSFITNRFGLNYRVMDKKYNFTLGLTAEPTSLEGSSSSISPTHKTRFNFSPVVRYVYNFSELEAVTINYQGESNSPTYNQLQPVIDFSNTSYPVQGNPDLLPEYNNNLQIKYNKFSNGTGKVFFTNLNLTQSNNKILANTVTYPGNYITNSKLAGAILTKYRNAAGFYNASANYLLLKPLAKRKLSLLINGDISYNNNISYLTDVLDSLGLDQTNQKNVAKNLVLSQAARIRLDIPDVVDADLNARYSINQSNNTVPEANVNNHFQAITFGANGKLYFFKDWTLSYNYSKTIYKGFKGAINPNVLNTYIEWRFLKNKVGTLRFSVFDLFNENTGFTSTQNAYAITQSNVNRLGRYYLLTFSLKLQKFSGKVPMGAPGGPDIGG